MTEEKSLSVRVSAKAAKQGAGFTDPATGFTISPGQEKPLGPRIGVLTRARLASGFLIRVEKAAGGDGAQAPAESKPAEPEAPEAKPDKKKGFFSKGK